MIKFNIDGAVDQLAELKVKKTIKKILNEVARRLKVKGKHYLSYIIVDNEEIHHINKEYRGIDRPTDVITFALIDAEPDRSIPEELGDIFISWEKVVEQAKEYGHSNLREFSFLVTHGALHALGYDHQTEEDEKVMFALQYEILNKLKILR